jgi:methionyl-tRNA synthetase
MVTFDEFAKLDIRVGKILNVEDHEQARKPMYRLTIDFGPEIGQRTIIAGIKPWYPREELINRKVVCVVNLDPKSIAGVESHGMVLAADDSENVTLLTIDKDVKEGSRVR